MRKVLQVITLSDWGGAQKVVYDLAAGLAGFVVEVACAPGGPLVDELGRQGIPVHVVPSLRRSLSPLHDARALFSLYRLMRRGGYDVVHCHSSKAGLLGRLAARAAGVRRVFFTAHGWGFYNRKEYGALERFLTSAERLAARASDAVVCVSRATMAEGLARRIAGPEKFLVIYNGMEQVPEGPADDTLRRVTGTDGPVVVMTARLAYPKEPLSFLAAAARTAAAYPGAGFALVGDGPQMGACRAMVAREAPRVALLGFRSDASRLLTGADVFVLLSEFEGLPLTVIEAMQAGLPVVAYAVGGLAELVEDGRSGFLVRPGDVDGVAARIGTLLGDPGLRRRMGEAGRARARAHFDRAAMVQAYSRLYGEEQGS